MRFGIHLVRRGVISSEQLVDAVDRQLNSRPPIGALAIETRRLSMHDVFEILRAQATSHEKFGQLAVELGHLRKNDIADLLAMQSERTRPIHELLLESGAVEEETLQQEWKRFHVSMADADPLDAAVAVAGENDCLESQGAMASP